MQHHDGPVIVDDSGDIGFFRTAEDAERYLEPWCVEYGITAYDAKGLQLHIEPSHPRFGVTLLIPDIQRDCAAKLEMRLREIFLQFAERFGLDEQWVRSASFPELVAWGLDRLAQR